MGRLKVECSNPKGLGEHPKNSGKEDGFTCEDITANHYGHVSGK